MASSLGLSIHQRQAHPRSMACPDTLFNLCAQVPTGSTLENILPYMECSSYSTTLVPSQPHHKAYMYIAHDTKLLDVTCCTVGGTACHTRDKTAMLWDDYCGRVNHCGQRVTLGYTILACPTHSLQSSQSLAWLAAKESFAQPCCTSNTRFSGTGQSDGIWTWCCRGS